VVFRATLRLDRRPDEPIWLELERLSVPVVEVRVNGASAGHLAWRPYRIALEQYVHEGENAIELVFYHSLRNLLGPHHDPDGESYDVGPQSFRGSGDRWADQLVEGQAIAGWRPSYEVTEFGLLGEVRVLLHGGAGNVD
jgi:hypothetical protein